MAFQERQSDLPGEKLKDKNNLEQKKHHTKSGNTGFHKSWTIKRFTSVGASERVMKDDWIKQD